MTVFLCLFPLGWLTVYVLFTRTQCLLLPLVANLWNINEISLKRHSADSDMQVFSSAPSRGSSWHLLRRQYSNRCWQKWKVTRLLPVYRVADASVTPHPYGFGGVFTRVHASQMSHFGKRYALWEHRQETIMSWNAKCVWGRRMKLALLLVLTPTFEHLMPRLQ